MNLFLENTIVIPCDVMNEILFHCDVWTCLTMFSLNTEMYKHNTSQFWQIKCVYDGLPMFHYDEERSIENYAGSNHHITYENSVHAFLYKSLLRYREGAARLLLMNRIEMERFMEPTHGIIKMYLYESYNSTKDIYFIPCTYKDAQPISINFVLVNTCHTSVYLCFYKIRCSADAVKHDNKTIICEEMTFTFDSDDEHSWEDSDNSDDDNDDDDDDDDNDDDNDDSEEFILESVPKCPCCEAKEKHDINENNNEENLNTDKNVHEVGTSNIDGESENISDDKYKIINLKMVFTLEQMKRIMTLFLLDSHTVYPDLAIVDENGDLFECTTMDIDDTSSPTEAAKFSLYETLCYLKLHGLLKI